MPKKAEEAEKAKEEPKTVAVPTQEQSGGHGESVGTTTAVKESEATATEPTKVVPAGSADSTADSTADGRHNGTENTHPQSPTHKGDLSDKDLKAVVDEFNAPGAQVLAIAEKYGVTSERVFEIVDDANGVAPEDRV